MSNSRIFALGWCVALTAQFALRVAGMAPERGIFELIAGAVMTAAWGFAAVALFGDRRAA